MPNLPKPVPDRFREILTANRLLLKVAGFEPDPTGGVYPILDNGEDWAYLSGRWDARPDGEFPLVGITTNADIVAWRVKGGTVTRVYLANGSYAVTADGPWEFEVVGNHYADNQK